MTFTLLERHVREGELTVVEPAGARHCFGTGTPKVTWQLRKPDAYARIARNPAYELGQTYMEGGWDVTEGDLADLLRLMRKNVAAAVMRSGRVAALARVLQSWNDVQASLRNVARHYDLDETLFRTFLDRQMHYSCAYYRRADDGLEAAQEAKCEHIAAKLALADGQRILDIGSGWGALAFHLAARRDVTITGLTLSQEQLRVATAAAAQRGLAGRVTFRLEDYRQHHGRYDRIVSVGMFEHVGRRNHRRFMQVLDQLLGPDGVVVLHTIGSTRPPAPTNPWIRQYIFPGGYIPTVGEVATSIDRTGLIVTDLEILRNHYALTLHEWNRRFQARRREIAERLGEEFCRMWEFYLLASATAFEAGDLVVQQWQLARRGTTLPLTRDYLYRGEESQE
jgi:cyclopropane-fatty-acyl-phospholipid synthase